MALLYQSFFVALWPLTVSTLMSLQKGPPSAATYRLGGGPSNACSPAVDPGQDDKGLGQFIQLNGLGVGSGLAAGPLAITRLTLFPHCFRIVLQSWKCRFLAIDRLDHNPQGPASGLALVGQLPDRAPWRRGREGWVRSRQLQLARHRLDQQLYVGEQPGERRVSGNRWGRGASPS